MHARLDRGAVRLLTRTGLNWTHKYPAIASAVSSLGAKQAYLDGELSGVRPDGTTSFSMIQAASDSGNTDALVFFLFDLLYISTVRTSARRQTFSAARPASRPNSAHCGGRPWHGHVSPSGRPRSRFRPSSVAAPAGLRSGGQAWIFPIGSRKKVFSVRA
jgi:hypothetical protein